MICTQCGDPLTAARRRAMPHTRLCTSCQAQQDVPRTQGYMSFEHKTAPAIIIGRDAELVRPYDRRGFKTAAKVETRTSAGIGFRSVVESVDADVVNTPRARCHPDAPRINMYGQCLACALARQAERVVHRSMR